LVDRARAGFSNWVARHSGGPEAMAARAIYEGRGTTRAVADIKDLRAEVVDASGLRQNHVDALIRIYSDPKSQSIVADHAGRALAEIAAHRHEYGYKIIQAFGARVAKKIQADDVTANALRRIGSIMRSYQKTSGGPVVFTGIREGILVLSRAYKNGLLK